MDFSMCIYVNTFLLWFLFGIYYKDSIRNLLKKGNNAKKLLEKLQLKMNHIFKCPYHNHFWIDFKFFITCMLKELSSWVIYHMDFINSLITMQFPRSSNDITMYFHFDTTKWTCMGHILFTKRNPNYFATIHLVLGLGFLV